jgi:tRNA(Arg) A34 adenosine deaminase TadA
MNSNKFRILQKYYRSLPVLPRGKHRVVCAIWEKNKIISFGHNQFKTHPRQVLSQKNYNPTRECLHAEIHALIQAGNNPNWSAKDSAIYVYRETKAGLPVLAAPCDGCRAALDLAGVRKIFYTTP